MSDTYQVYRSEAKILVVDNDAGNLSVMSKILKEEGYQISIAYSGESALQNAPKTQPDLILLDVVMPGLDGFETCQELKARPETTHIPIILVTGLARSAEDVVAGFRAGAVDYISKPVRQEEVCARIRNHLQIRALSEQFRAIVNNISEALIITDKTGIIRFSNPAAEHLLAYHSQELIGKSAKVLLNAPYGDEYIAYFAATVDERSASQKIGYGPREVTATRKDGTIFDTDVSVSEVFLHEPAFIVLLRDISLRKRSEAELKRIAEIDQLTNIANRRRFNEVLEAEWEQARKAIQPLALLMCDVDYFKLYNDAHGHQAGDRCLRRVADAIKGCIREPPGLLARYGGEEFVVILPECGEKAANSIGEAVRKSVVAQEIPHAHSPIAAVVTISVGVARTVPSVESTSMHLVQAADTALYAAKQSGRNRVIHSYQE